MAVGPASGRSRDINFSTVSGFLVEDPALRYTGKGVPLCQFRIGCEVTVGSTTYSEWFNIHTFGELGQRCYEQLSSGDRIVMFGRWHERAYKDEQGKWHRYQNFIADEVAISVMNRMTEWRQQRDLHDRNRSELLDVAERPAYDHGKNPLDRG